MKTVKDPVTAPLAIEQLLATLTGGPLTAHVAAVVKKPEPEN